MNDDCRVLIGDCREILPTIEGISVIITDPPYGLGFVKGSSGSMVKGRKSLRRHVDLIPGDDEPFDPSHLLRWPCVLFGADHYRERLPPGGSFHVWNKRCGIKLEDSFSDAELIWHSKPGKTRIINHLWKGVCQGSEKGRRKYHRAQKPVFVMRRLIEWFTRPGDLVVDPYAGSGSTGVAAIETGRRCILIEQGPEWLPIIEGRLAECRSRLLGATA
jgi:site-specific DNA-methyltransferase (adenine-specific)